MWEPLKKAQEFISFVSFEQDMWKK
jgi:hypothetical protein